MLQLNPDSPAEVSAAELWERQQDYGPQKLILAPRGGVEKIKQEDSDYRVELRRRRCLHQAHLVLAFLTVLANFYSLSADVLEALAIVLQEQKPAIKERMLITVAFFEFVGFTGLVLGLLYSLSEACGNSSYQKWSNIGRVAWFWIRILSKFSAIMWIGLAHPSLILEDFQAVTAYHDRQFAEWGRFKCCARCVSRYFYQIRFVLSRLAWLLLGATAFPVKVMILGGALTKTVEATETQVVWSDVCGTSVKTAVFINQCLGMLDISYRLRMRSLAFVFGGKNPHTRCEMVNVDVYRANVAQEVWKACEQEQGAWCGAWFAMAALFNFSHLDVQRLSVEPHTCRSHIY